MRLNVVVFALAGVALVSCMRANAGTPVTPIDVRHATPGAPSDDVPEAKGACLIREQKSTLDLKVRGGDQLFDLRVMELPTESTLDRDGSAIVHVRSDIEFEGRLALAQERDGSETWLHVARAASVLGGLVKVGDGTAIFKARRTADAASGIVVMGGYEVEGVAVPCDVIGFGERGTAWPAQLTSDDEDSEEEREISWVTGRNDVLSVCASPSSRETCVRAHEMTFEALGRKGSTVEVRARFDDGSEIHGWAPADDVKKADEPALGGYGMSGGCGCGHGIGRLRGGKPDPREHIGKATLKAGSEIYAQADLKGAWGRAARDVEISIEMFGPDDYARVTSLPGIGTTVGCSCDGMDDHAWVKRVSVIPIH